MKTKGTMGARGVWRTNGGFSLVEVVIALAILSIVLLTSLSAFIERSRRLREARESILVWQTIANEAALTRRVPWAGLVPGQDTGFRSDLTLLSRVPGVDARVTVGQSGPGSKQVRVRVTWRDGARTAEAVVVRTDTGGGNLW